MQVQSEMFPGERINTNGFTSTNRILSLEQQREVNKVQKQVLIIVGILLGLSIIDFIVSLITHVTVEEDRYVFRLISALLSIVYYGFGFSVARRYSRTGLLIFAWLGLLSLLAFAAIILGEIIYVIKLTKIDYASALLVMIITVTVCSLALVLQICAVRYAFVLSNLLEKAKPLTTA